MKFLKWFVAILIVLIGSIYILAFTSFGNGIVGPIVEGKIKEETKLDAKLQTFALDMSSIDIVLFLDQNNSISVKGNYSLFAQSFDLKYNVALNKLASLEKITQTKLSGVFLTDGTVIGDSKLLTIDGKSDVAKSTTTYNVELQEFNPTSIIAKINNLDLSTLLAMVGQKQYASAQVDLDVNFKNIKPHQLDGNVKLLTTDGKLNTEVMKKDFQLTIPETAFKMKLDAQLQGDELIYSYLLNSNLAKIGFKGKVVPEPLNIDTTYAVNVEELAVLKPITQADIRGSLNLSGSVKGSKEKLVIDGKSDIADSLTSFQADLKNFQPDSVKMAIKHLKLQKLLYMVKQPHYADATFDLEAVLSSLDPKNLQGKVKTTISEGVLDSQYFTKTYEFKSLMPYTTFSGTTNTVFKGTKVDTQAVVKSNLASLEIKQAVFDIKDSSITSDYQATLHDLDRLFFVTQRHLKGAIVATGELKKAKDLDFTLLSNFAGGKLDAKLHNDDFVAYINKMQTLDILDMLLDPKVFQSNIDGKVTYNLAQASGNFDAQLKDGVFLQNQILDLTKQFAKTDLYKQTFVGNTSAVIKKEHITALLDLKSNTSSIYTKDTKLNSKTKQIDSNIKIIANNNPAIYVTLQGNVESPKVTVDASAIIKDEANKAVKKEATKQLDKLFKKLF